jgi:hypothetical protein
VGDYHTNHFVAYSQEIPKKITSQPIPWLTHCNLMFSKYFTNCFDNDIAKASERTFKTPGRYIEFELGGTQSNFAEKLGGLSHSDWVVIRKPTDGLGFCGQTLQRNWKLTAELALVASAVLTVNPAAVAAYLVFIDVNQHHFLAGRRSFGVGFDVTLNRFFVETAAFERASLLPYELGDLIFRELIIEIWTMFLETFQTFMSTPVNRLAIRWAEGEPGHVPIGYFKKGTVAYMTSSQPNPVAALKEPWFADVLTRHSALTLGLNFSD